MTITQYGVVNATLAGQQNPSQLGQIQLATFPNPGGLERNFAMCDATEVFVLLAGYGAGLSYGMGLGRNGYISTSADVMKRAWTLYIAHIFLFVLFTAQVTYSATALNRLNYLEETRLDVLGDDPYRSMLQALLLRFQPSLLNILPLLRTADRQERCTPRGRLVP